MVKKKYKKAEELLSCLRSELLPNEKLGKAVIVGKGTLTIIKKK